MVAPIIIGLSSNINPEVNLQRALASLAARLDLNAVSRVYESAPLDSWGNPIPDRPHFLNAALLVETELPPVALKYDVLRLVEESLGRHRSRPDQTLHTIDLALLLYGDLVLDDPVRNLTLPDPDLLYLPYLILPAASLAPGFIHPVTRQALREIAASFGGSPGVNLSSFRLHLPGSD